MHKIYSLFRNIQSAKFFGCCSNSINFPYHFSRVFIDCFYNYDSENNIWYGDGEGCGYGKKRGNGLGYGEWGDDPIDFEKDYGDGQMTNYRIRCFLNKNEEWVAEQELLFVESCNDD